MGPRVGSTVLAAALVIAAAGMSDTTAFAKPDANAGSGAPAATPQFAVSTSPALYPAFSPSIQYYVTRCADSPVQVSVTAPTQVRTAVDGQLPQSGTFSTTVSLLQGQEFRASVRWGRHNSSVYHFRCLPADFPTWAAQRNGSTQASYYIVTPTLGGAGSPYVAVFDNNGVPRWWINSEPNPIDAKLLPTGAVSWVHASQGTAPQSARLDGSPSKTYNASGGYFVDHHELQVLSNGNYFLAVDITKPADLSPCNGAPGGSILDNQIQELSPNGTLLWSWNASDHIPLTEVDTPWQSSCRAGDPYHFNAIQPDGRSVLLSFRHLDAVYDVSLTDGSILWKLGGTTRPDGANLSVFNDPVFTAGGSFSGQHDVRLLPDGSVTIFDDGTGAVRPPRAVRYAIDLGQRTATLLEQVSDNSITNAFCCGSARRLSGGDWVVALGGDNPVEELTSTGSVVFSLGFGGGLFSYRAVPIPHGFTSHGFDDGMNHQYPRPPGG